MKGPAVLLLAVLGSAIVSGCNTSPVVVEPRSEAGRNSAEGGLVFGSGNRSEADSTTAATSSEGGDSGGQDGRRGLVFGSGN